MELSKKQLGLILLFSSLVLIIILIIIKIIFDSQTLFMCELVDLEDTLTMSDCPGHNQTHSWLLTSGFIISGLILALGLFYLTPKKNKKIFADINKSSLNVEELKIYEYLVSKQGMAYQSDIVKDLEFSKVKTTRILDSLEQKAVLERKRRGMTNQVVLK